MSVSVLRSYTVQKEGCEGKWLVPHQMMKDVAGRPWVQIRASCKGLCKLLGGGQLTSPSFKGSTGLLLLLQQRNEKSNLLVDEKNLFANEANPPNKKKRKAQEPAEAEGQETVRLDLGSWGELEVLKAKRKNQDLSIPLEAASFEIFFGFMLQQGISFDEPTRTYTKSGLYRLTLMDYKGKYYATGRRENNCNVWKLESRDRVAFLWFSAQHEAFFVANDVVQDRDGSWEDVTVLCRMDLRTGHDGPEAGAVYVPWNASFSSEVFSCSALEKQQDQLGWNLSSQVEELRSSLA
ncbi:unnamed protein product, partial [Symbiodinium sp. CCMP2456]